MKRNEWTWEKSAAELAEAAETQVDYHVDRLRFWQQERETAQTAVTESGLQIRTHPQTGGERHEVVIDPTLTQRLAECEQKIRSHEASRDEYAKWVQVLHSEPERRFTLDHTDYTFFFDQMAADE